MTQNTAQARQSRAALLARGRTLVMRAFSTGLEDDHSATAQALRQAFVKILRSAGPSHRKGIAAALESFIDTLNDRRTLHRGRAPEVDCGTGQALHSILIQASALATQLDLLEFETALIAHRAA